jgi:hypothetical protein
MGIHEQPTISKTDDAVLQSGMVFTVEPAIYIPQFGGVRIEDMVLVTDWPNFKLSSWKFDAIRDQLNMHWPKYMHDRWNSGRSGCKAGVGPTGYIPGDVNGDGIANSADVVFLINYLYKGDVPPITPIAGNVNGDSVIDIGDVVHLINYLFKSGYHPNPLIAGDANCDGKVTIADVIYLINYLFIDGPAPGCP